MRFINEVIYRISDKQAFIDTFILHILESNADVESFNSMMARMKEITRDGRLYEFQSMFDESWKQVREGKIPSKIKPNQR